MTLSLHTLPIEITYHILDHLNEIELFLTLSVVSQRMNSIVNSYLRYRVNLNITFGIFKISCYNLL